MFSACRSLDEKLFFIFINVLIRSLWVFFFRLGPQSSHLLLSQYPLPWQEAQHDRRE
jgi:hypothetical protein